VQLPLLGYVLTLLCYVAIHKKKKSVLAVACCTDYYQTVERGQTGKKKRWLRTRMSTEREKVVYENRVLAKSRVFGFGKKQTEDWRDCCGQDGEPPNWSNDDGKIKLDLDEVRPDEGWSWTANWKIEIGTDCDRKGWQYATKYARFAANRTRSDRCKAKRSDKYCRRRWVRAMQRKDGITYSVEPQRKSTAPTRIFSTKEVQRGLQKIDVAICRVEQHIKLVGGTMDSRNLRQQMRRERIILKQFIGKAQAGMHSIRQQQTEKASTNSAGVSSGITKAEFNKLNREFEGLSEKYTKVRQQVQYFFCFNVI
jgi:hypothetical protein